MPISTIVFMVLLAALVIVVGYRKLVANSVDDLVHVNDASVISKQESVARTLAQLDRVVTILIVVTVIYGLAAAALYGYRAFNSGTSI